ncbi:hypothetical protein DL98DRAFT_149140 [Cadophora sp. DSE1049]|nr:hypothetical protein DL98DRAFT_149140 [Cadophora sp. DSE1049]
MFPLLLTLLGLFLTIASASLIPYANICITSSEYDRYYLPTHPPSLDPKAPTPVVFSFHGGNRIAEQQYHLSRMSDTYFDDFAIAVYP